MTNIAPALGAIELRDDQNQPVVLVAAWADQPALLVFIRHFG